MRRFIVFGLFIAGMACSTMAQIDASKLITGNQASPEAIAAIHYGPQGKMIWIFYHAPSLLDPKTKEPRHIFNGPGALQPDGTVWRLGADFVTILHTDADLDFGGLTVPKGEYALYVDLDKGSWKLIVNKQVMDAKRGRPLWGVANHKGDTTDDPATELGRINLAMGKIATPVERLKIDLARTGDAQGRLDIAWENVTASTPFTVK